MPFISSISARQSGLLFANAAKLIAPLFGSPTSTAGGFTFSITNYDSSLTYSFGVSEGGSATRSGGLVTVTGLANAVNAICYVTVNKSGWLSNSSSRTGTSFSKLATPTFTSATATNTGWFFTIGNYDAANTYTLGTTSGSVGRSGAIVTQSGVGYSATTTISITASRSGFITSNTATQAGTSNAAPPYFPPPCDPNCYFITYTCVGTLSYEYYQSSCPAQPCEGGYNGAFRSGICGCC
jgi:hypothetical protein